MRVFEVSRTHRALIAATSIAGLMLFSGGVLQAQERLAQSWRSLVEADGPAIWWSFDGKSPIGAETSGVELKSVTAGKVLTAKTGPGRAVSRLFSDRNSAIEFDGTSGAIKVTDPGEKSLLDFDRGDAFTIEAWVQPRPFGGARYMYIAGKGRTRNKGFDPDNQSYALRLQGIGSDAVLSFLFRSAADDKKGSEFHRWTSGSGFPVDGRWHHVAVTYQFGKADSLRGYVDGKPVSGAWDMGGATSRAPVVDDDELWIGSSMGMQSGSTFNGLLDEVAIYRKALTEDRVRARVPFVPRADEPPMPESAPPRDAVLVEVFEGIPNARGWGYELKQSSESWFEPSFAFFDMPERYNARGVTVDRSNPLVLRASNIMQVPAGSYQLLLRTLRYGRVFVDGKLVVETPVRPHRPDAHGNMYTLKSTLAPGSRQLYPGAEERMADVEFDGRPHEIRVEIHVGGDKRRLELGETSLSIAMKASSTSADQTASDGETPFKVLSPSLEIPLTDVGWEAYETRRREEYVVLNQQRRIEASQQEIAFWNRRHEIARGVVNELPVVDVPPAKNSDADSRPSLSTSIDRFVLAKLDEAGITPSEVVNDWTFLRRVALDVIGTPPTPEQIAEFLADQSEARRANYIDRMLQNPGWADHWVGYWQDVLAENPNVVNPTLNNTGPFRWWIHESFLDNKPFDRFVTELIQMEGSSHFGGPAGFEIATSNDVPYAAKAHIVGQAFMALQMKCARCHDAPYHNFSQRDLFSFAAMLRRKPQEVPKSSSVPVTSNSELVTMTMKPGDLAAVEWPFEGRFTTTIPAGFFRSSDAKDSRPELAARITSPHNDRFSEVIVNRLWQRYLGRGIVEPVDDWEHADPKHPELLKFLGREFVRNGYDVKALARMILNSQTYQRATQADVTPEELDLFASPSRRRLSAEQVLDSLFAASGKEFHAGDMNIDVDGSRNYTSSLNLGIPRRSWMFSSLSNERDRPSLSLPYAQPFVTLLQTFGWRDSRQDPITVRPQESTVLQPAILANGTIGRRFTGLSDDSAFTTLALQDRPLSELVDAVFRRVYTREPSSDEREVFMELLSDGFSDRINHDELHKPPTRGAYSRTGVGWSNHLAPEATLLQIETDERVRLGDPPTKKLQPEWRERFEDMLWSMLNSPEFLFVP